MQDLIDEHCHSVAAEEVLRLLGTDPGKGLDLFEIEERQRRFGPNELSERRPESAVRRFVRQLEQPLVVILVAAAAITAALGEWVDSGVIVGVVLVNAIVGFIQEGRALEAISALARTLTPRAVVLRAGGRKTIPSTQLVPGDVVLLQSGDRVPADLRLVRIRDLQIDESALTGESVPVAKETRILDPNTSLAERRNLAFSSSLVTYGTGSGVVVATGDATQIGRISELIASVEILETPLTRRIARFSHVLLGVILAVCTLTFAVGVARGQPWFETFLAVVALAVGAIPEGLPAAITIMLAIGVSRMARRHAVIRRLPAVEALGSTTVVCSDKTGTLTQNQMTVREILTDDSIVRVEGVGYAAEGGFFRGDLSVDPHGESALLELLRAGMLCNDSAVREVDGRWIIEGDPTEAALLVAACKAGLREEALLQEWPRLDAVPFESQHQYMATLHHGGVSNRAFVKGSLEAILARCNADGGGDGTLDLDAIHQRAAEMGARGLRVLAFSRKDFPSEKRALDHADIETGLVFLGLQAMLDPPRPEAIRSVAMCQRAGIRVKMITGDHATTASAIAAQLGLDGVWTARPEVLTGRDLAMLTDAELLERAQEVNVFARVSPEQKLRLVEALQARGQVVAMTGDGVNDAPALRRADIGVAMGLAGTEVAREAADMVLTDDNFATIEAAVEEGRGIFDNLLKFIVWTLPTNGGEGAVLMLAILLGTALPILPVQILWINMTTAVCLGLTLAFEPKEAGIMGRPPRDPHELILTKALVLRILFVSGLLCAAAFSVFSWMDHGGASEAESRTAAVTVFVVGEMFYLFNCRSLTRSMFSVGIGSNPWIWLGVAAMTVLQLLFIYAPTMNRLFHTRPISIETWPAILGAGFGIHLAVGIEKWLRRRWSAD